MSQTSTREQSPTRRSRERLPRVHSTCPHDCPSTCALEVEITESGTIGRVYGAKDNSYTEGVICAKVSRYAERIHHPERLTRPLMRKPGSAKNLLPRTGGYNSVLADRSEFEPISWDDALDVIAQRYRKITDEFGAEAIWPYHYAGTMGLVQRDCIERMRNLMGTSRQHATFCITLADAGWKAGTGAKRGSDSRHMQDSDLIVVWGGNPVSTQVNVMHHIAKARRNNGAKMIVVDPYRTGTAEKADQHLMLRPGTDGALACAVIHVLLAEGFADREYLASHTDFNADIEQHFASRTPGWASEITGLSTEEIVQFARTYGATKKSFMRCGYGFSRSRNGSVNMHAATCLPAITGAWLHVGGGALYSQGDIYKIDTSLNQASDRIANTRVLDQSRLGEVLTGNTKDLQRGPPIKALFVQNTNPLVVAPDSNKVYAGLVRDDLFTVVHEQFMTETARVADIVLPATMFLEHDDMYQAGGHTHFQVTRKVVEPFAECRSNHYVVSEILKRLGHDSEADHMDEWQIMDGVLAKSGYPDAETLYDQHWHDRALPFETANFIDGFGTPDGKFHFKPDWSRVGPDSDGMPELPDHWPTIDQPTDEKPFRLVAAPSRQFLNTSFTETPSSRKMEKRPSLKIHPDDCKTLGIADGDLIAVGNNLGEVRLNVESFDGVQIGTVVCESLWPIAEFGDDSSAEKPSLGINVLISSEPGKPNGGAVFHDTAVWVEAVV